MFSSCLVHAENKIPTRFLKVQQPAGGNIAPKMSTVRWNIQVLKCLQGVTFNTFYVTMTTVFIDNLRFCQYQTRYQSFTIFKPSVDPIWLVFLQTYPVFTCHMTCSEGCRVSPAFSYEGTSVSGSDTQSPERTGTQWWCHTVVNQLFTGYVDVN